MSRRARVAATRRAAPAGARPVETDLAAAVARLAATLAGAPDVATVASRLLALLAPATGADRASLMLVNPATGALHVAAGVGIPAEHVGRDTPPRAGSIAEWVLRERRAELLQGVVRGERLESTSERPIASSLCMPLACGTGAFGVLNLARTSPPAYAEADRAAVEAALPAIARALAAARAAARADRLAGQLDAWTAHRGLSLLAPGVHGLHRWEMAGAHVPSAARAGDLAERVVHPNGDVTVLAADVAGAGVDAALTAAFVHGLFVASAAPERGPALIAARLAAELRRRGSRHAALWLARLTPSGELFACSAGYPPALWMPAAGGDPVWLAGGGPPAGTDEARWEEEQVRLLPGDLVVAVSDGVLQAAGASGVTFGAERVAELVAERRRRGLDEIAAAVTAAVREWSGRDEPVDDLAVLAIRFRPDV